jgi:hypothetical protein
MPRPPLSHPSAIFRPPEVVLVLRFAQPSTLAQRLGNLAALRLPTMALAPTITEIGNEQLSTMQTFALCASLHRQTATLPRKLKETPVAPIKKSHALQPEESQEQQNNTQEEECCPQALEEDLRSTKHDFQTARFTRFPNRR